MVVTILGSGLLRHGMAFHILVAPMKVEPVRAYTQKGELLNHQQVHTNSRTERCVSYSNGVPGFIPGTKARSVANHRTTGLVLKTDRYT